MFFVVYYNYSEYRVYIKTIEGHKKMKINQFVIILLGFCLSITTISCNTGTERDFSLDEYESIKYWELTNELSDLSLSNYIVFDGGHSIQIINGGCGDLETESTVELNDVTEQNLESVEGQSYSLSITVKRSPTDYDENTPVEPAENEDEILRGENFSTIITQGSRTLLDEETKIESDLTWETKTYTFIAAFNAPIKLIFRLGCDLDMFWLDKIEFSYIEPEPEEVEP